MFMSGVRGTQVTDSKPNDSSRSAIKPKHPAQRRQFRHQAQHPAQRRQFRDQAQHQARRAVSSAIKSNTKRNGISSAIEAQHQARRRQFSVSSPTPSATASVQRSSPTPSATASIPRSSPTPLATAPVPMTPSPYSPSPTAIAPTRLSGRTAFENAMALYRRWPRRRGVGLFDIREMETEGGDCRATRVLCAFRLERSAEAPRERVHQLRVIFSSQCICRPGPARD